MLGGGHNHLKHHLRYGKCKHSNAASIWIATGRSSETISSIIHPMDSHQRLYFMADVPHLIKNIKSCLLRDYIVYEGRKISITPIQRLAEFQEHRELKLAPSLKLKAVKNPSHFDKMKVSNALHILSNSVAKGLQWMVDNNHFDERERKEAQDTAWFILLINQWFKLMSSRAITMALSRRKPGRYESPTRHLKTVIDVVKNMRVGGGHWIPFQTGMLISTSTVLTLSEESFDQGLSFLMTARLSQDCLENLFSCVRIKNPGVFAATTCRSFIT